ncbi:MAG: ABC transporter substrate-binding protein [Alkaliphilus sp.]
MFRKRQKLYLTLVLLLVLSLVFTACGKDEDVDKVVEDDGQAVNEETHVDTKYGGVFRSYLSGDFNTLDPAFATASMDGQMVSLLYDSLIRFGTDGEIIPSLAKSWEIVDDKTIIFNLVDNATFHNGNPLTANDVKYSFERVLDPEVGSPRTWVFDKVEGATAFMEGNADEVAGIEVLDDYKISIALEAPFAPFLSMLGMPAAHIVDRNEIERHADPKDYGLNPVGTGPFKFVQYTEGDRFEVETFEDYFAGRAFVDGIEYRIIKDSSTAAAEFEAGNLDVLSIPSVDIDRFVNNADYAPYIHNYNSLWNFYIGLMFDKEPFDDVRIRRAFNYAVDREAIVNTVRRNTAVLSNGPIPPGLDGFREGRENPYPFNPEKAKELLAEAGFSVENPVSFELWHSDSATNVALLEPIQAMLNQVGFDVSLVAREWNAYKAAVVEGEPHAYYMAWGADYPDAENYLFPLFHSSNFGGAGNSTRYNNPEFDKIMEQAHATADRDERIALYQEAEDIIIADAVRCWMFLSRRWLIYSPEVQDVTLYRIFNADKMLDIWLEK